MSRVAEDLAPHLWRLNPSAMLSHLQGSHYKRFRHLEFLAGKIARAVAIGGAWLIVEAPPRHGKSTLLSLGTPVWFLSMFPSKRVMLLTYADSLAVFWGRQSRNLITAHGEELGVELSDDSSAANDWHTTQGGGMKSAGFDGSVTGRGADLIIIDDPHKNYMEAHSPTMRRRVIEGWQADISTRLEPGGTVLVTCTRWHHADLIGWMLSDRNAARDKITRYRLPAVAEENDPLGRKVGEALCPERKDEQALKEQEAKMLPRMWSALFQQAPRTVEGAVIEADWWKYYTVRPIEFDVIIASWDLTFEGDDPTAAQRDAETKESRVVGTVWGKLGPDFYLLDMVRGRWKFTQQITEIKNLNERWPSISATYVEKKANGAAALDVLRKELSGLIPVEPRGSKIIRAEAIAPLVKAGNVHLPTPEIAPWVIVFEAEWAEFPSGSTDDIVDSTSQALSELQSGFRADALPDSIESANIWEMDYDTVY